MKMSAGTHCKGRLTRSLAGYEFSSTKATKSERINRTFFTNSIISVETKGHEVQLYYNLVLFQKIKPQFSLSFIFYAEY